MRVLHVISADLWAGAAVQVSHSLSDLRRRNVDVLVAVFNDGIMVKRLEADGIAWQLLDEKKLSTAGIAKGLARLIAATAPHCLHVHAYKEHILAVTARLLAGRHDLPIIRTLHGRTALPSGLRGVRLLKAQTVEGLERLLLGRSVLIAVSTDLQRFLRETYPHARVELVRNGISLPVDVDGRKEARARWGVPEDAFWVGSVARLETVKNLPCLLRAAAVVREKVPVLRVSIFGTGSQHAVLQRLIRDLGAEAVVTLHGFDDQMPATMSGFDCFVLSSLDEGMPMSLLEAMALGIPPVCSGVGGMRELIRPGETGLLFESDNHAELASRLARVHESKAFACRLGLAARQFVRESFAIEVTNAALVDVYRSLIPGSGVEQRTEEQQA